ncbi:MAG: alpha/beta hydrolase [Candidatus Coatesbacteria bacterium]|nr:alpha/beta hydrolase [Candidatus Coatesbacteria bacterium]
MRSILAFILLLVLIAGKKEEKIEKYADILYIKDSKNELHKLDIYKKLNVKNAPVLIFIHGGAWRLGSKDNKAHKDIGRIYSRKGIVVVEINYRLSPKVKHPSHIEDVASAFNWVKQNISRYGGDPEKIYISGHSAGAHLCALLALDARYLAKYNLRQSDIKGAIPISGPMKIENNRGIIARKWFKDAFGNDISKWKDASPINFVSEDSPKFLILYGENDGLVPKEYNIELYNKLKEKKVSCRIVEMKEYNHMMMVRKAGEGIMLKEILSFINSE